MAAGKSSRINRQYKTKYRIRNWRKYERGLRSRDLKAPDHHTTLSRRKQIIVVPPLTRAHDGPIDLIVDSTGLKIPGRGASGTRTSTRYQRNAGIGGSCTSEWMRRGSLWRPNSQRVVGTTPPHSLIFSPRSKFPSGVSRRTGPTTTDRSTIGPARPVQRRS